MLKLRNSMPPSELDSLSSKIVERLRGLPEIDGAATVSAYAHAGSEVRTMEVIRWCLAEGKRVIVPVTDKANRRLIFSELRVPEQELEPGAFGIPEPKTEFLRPVNLAEAQVIMVPGVAWDERGFRVGYGGGFYDRALNWVRPRPGPLKIGLSYELQIVGRIPTTAYDRPVEKIVTEDRLISAAARRNAIYKH